jgi:hypothetical protein
MAADCTHHGRLAGRNRIGSDIMLPDGPEEDNDDDDSSNEPL